MNFWKNLRKNLSSEAFFYIIRKKAGLKTRKENMKKYNNSIFRIPNWSKCLELFLYPSKPSIPSYKKLDRIY